MQIGQCKVSAWYRRDYGPDDRLHFDDLGVNVRRTRLNFTAHYGPNKLRRYPGYQAGIEFAGGVRSEYMLLRLWAIYWTLNIGVTWHERKP